jgi:hypothetical protein
MFTEVLQYESSIARLNTKCMEIDSLLWLEKCLNPRETKEMKTDGRVCQLNYGSLLSIS